MKNPWIVRLASLYRELGLGDKARPLYEQALENNPYEVPAILGLAEMDIDVGIPEALMAAEGRLTGLLKWMPENSIALVDLGVVYHAQGRTTDAIRAYHEALELEPGNAIAALNLAEIYNGSGDHVRAKQYFEHAVSQGVESIEHAKACHDFFIAQRTPKRAVDMWVEFTSRYPESLEGRSFLAWSRALSGDYANAAAHAEAMVDGDPPMPLAVATLAYVGLATAEYDVANTWADRLCAAAESGVETRQRLLRALGAIVQQRPDDPWAFCVAAKLWMADGHIDPGAEFIALCEQRCRDARCTELVEVLRTRLTE